VVIVETGQNHGAGPWDEVSAHMLVDGHWVTERWFPATGREVWSVRATGSAAGDVVIWWGDYAEGRPAGAAEGNMMVAVRPAAESAFRAPQVLAPINFKYAEGVVLHSGEIVLTYEASGPVTDTVFSRYDFDSDSWSPGERMFDVPGFADVDLRPDGRAFAEVFTPEGPDRMYDCVAVDSCIAVDRLDLYRWSRGYVLARPGGGAIAFEARERCPDEDCSMGGLRATLLPGAQPQAR
jgi:hypothetical protein